MEPNTGYVITDQNAHLLATISGIGFGTVSVNRGWAVIYEENPYPRWSIMPKNAAQARNGFKWVDSPLNGLPTRTEKEIRQEWAELNKTYSEKLDELKKELERAKLRDEGDNVEPAKAFAEKTTPIVEPLIS